MPETRRPLSELARTNLGPVDQELREMYLRALMRRGGPTITASTGQEPEQLPWGHDTTRPTEVVGSPELARDVETLFRTVPALRGLVTKVISGPNEGVFDRLRGSGFQDDEYGRTNLLGQYGINTHEITLNPTMSTYADSTRQRFASDPFEPSDRAATLAHEFGHAAGEPHGRQLNNIEGVARMRDEYLRALREQELRQSLAQLLDRPERRDTQRRR